MVKAAFSPQTKGALDGGKWETEKTKFIQGGFLDFDVISICPLTMDGVSWPSTSKKKMKQYSIFIFPWVG